MDHLHAQPPEANPAKAQAADAEKPATEEKPAAEELSGFELLEAYAQKITRLETFQKERFLRDTDLQARKSRAADEVNRVIGGLKLLMDQEAERLFDEAMSSDDPKVRDSILEKLRDSRFQLQDVRRRAENELKGRTVGETIYPTIEEAREKARQLEEERRKKLEDVDNTDLEDLEKLKQEELTDRINKAAQAFAEEDARMLLEKAERLVFPQRKGLLEEIVRKHPNTQAAADARALLDHLKSHNEFLASHKLHEALKSSVIFDQRWRRLKEIERHYPGTQAAMEAKRMFEEHLAHVPPVAIANPTDQKVELTVDVPYSRLKNVDLKPGQSESHSSAFPLVVRVNIGADQWTVYRALPGQAYYLQTTNGIPVLYCSP